MGLFDTSLSRVPGLDVPTASRVDSSHVHALAFSGAEEEVGRALLEARNHLRIVFGEPVTARNTVGTMEFALGEWLGIISGLPARPWRVAELVAQLRALGIAVVVRVKEIAVSVALASIGELLFGTTTGAAASAADTVRRVGSAAADTTRGAAQLLQATAAAVGAAGATSQLSPVFFGVGIVVVLGLVAWKLVDSGVVKIRPRVV